MGGIRHQRTLWYLGDRLVHATVKKKDRTPEHPTWQEVLDRVAYWQVELGLRHWDFKVICDPGMEKHVAHCSDWDGEYLTGTLYFDPDRIPRGELDAFVIHEMCCHPLLWPISAVAERMAGKNKRLVSLVRLAEEQATNTLERVILKLVGERKS